MPSIDAVRQGKVFDIELADGTDAEAALKGSCGKLLANTLIENDRVELLRRPPSSSLSNREGDALRALRAAGIMAELDPAQGAHDLPAGNPAFTPRNAG